jgi:hypothetical protein
MSVFIETGWNVAIQNYGTDNYNPVFQGINGETSYYITMAFLFT